MTILHLLHFSNFCMWNIKYKIFLSLSVIIANMKHVTCHPSIKSIIEENQETICRSTVSFFDPWIKKNKSHYSVVKAWKKYIFFGNPSEWNTAEEISSSCGHWCLPPLDFYLMYHFTNVQHVPEKKYFFLPSSSFSADKTFRKKERH